MNWVSDFGPLVLLVVFYGLMLWQLGKGNKSVLTEKFLADSLVEQRRMNELLEKLIAQHDDRLRRLEDEKSSV